MESELDKARFGGFVAEERRRLGLTQKELARRLYVSDKAVSKWERGLSLPDVPLLIPLAGELEATVTELLEGRRLEPAEQLEPDRVERLVRGTLHLAERTRERFLLPLLVLADLLLEWQLFSLCCRRLTLPYWVLALPVRLVFLLAEGWLAGPSPAGRQAGRRGHLLLAWGAAAVFLLETLAVGLWDGPDKGFLFHNALLVLMAVLALAGVFLSLSPAGRDDPLLLGHLLSVFSAQLAVSYTQQLLLPGWGGQYAMVVRGLLVYLASVLLLGIFSKLRGRTVGTGGKRNAGI